MKRLKVGRPPINEKEMTARKGLRIPIELARKIKKKKINISQVCRKALEKAIAA